MRKAADLSLAQLAQLSGASIGYLSEVERGEKTPTRRWLRDVDEALAEAMRKKSERAS